MTDSVRDETVIDRRMALAREWDEIVEQVRDLDGFESFLRPPPLETLLPAAAGGPVVIVNVSRWRCDALIVTPAGVRVRELPGLTLDDATDRASRYLGVLQSAESATSDYRCLRQQRQGDRTREAIAELQSSARRLSAAVSDADVLLTELQRWLWEVIAEPVLDEIGLTSAMPREATEDDLAAQEAEEAAWPRLWWCPTGPLTLLPLHTAGYHDERGGTAPRTVLDRVVSSYTPTLRALLEARRSPAGTVPDADRLLVVALEHTPGQPPLDGAADDLDSLARLFPSSHTALVGPAATRAAVLEELPRHRWVHFACHGDQNLTAPSDGALVLFDGRLTIANLSTGLFSGEFAGLAACKTAVGGVNLLDEVITLAAALHYTGYRHVVAALWSVHDTTTSAIFAAVYARLGRDGGLSAEHAAAALHRAVLAARERHPNAPRQWAPFTHTGP